MGPARAQAGPWIAVANASEAAVFGGCPVVRGYVTGRVVDLDGAGRRDRHGALAAAQGVAGAPAPRSVELGRLGDSLDVAATWAVAATS